MVSCKSNKPFWCATDIANVILLYSSNKSCIKSPTREEVEGVGFPQYLSVRCLIEDPRLSGGATVNVFVGTRPDLDHVFAVPKGLLCHYSPVLRHKLVMGQEKVVILERSDKRSVNWVLRWMLAGGVDKTGAPSEILDDDAATMDLLLRRLQVVDHLRLGQLCVDISIDLRNQFAKAAVNAEDIRWVHSQGLCLTSNGLRATLAEGILDSVLDYELVYSLDLVKSAPTFYHDMVLKVDSLETVKRVGALQRNTPLSTDQIRFLYELCAVNGHLRKTIAHGLLRLIDDGKVPDEQVYHNYAWENDEFEGDMVAAMKTKQRATDHAQYLERKAKREAEATAGQAAQAQGAKLAQGSGQRPPLASGAAKASSARGSKELKASGSTKVESITGKPTQPAQRVKSNTVLRLDTTGSVTRER